MRNQELIVFSVKWWATTEEVALPVLEILFHRSDYFNPGMSSRTRRNLFWHCSMEMLLISNPSSLFYISVILLHVASLKTILLLDFMQWSFARNLGHPLTANWCSSTRRTPSPIGHKPVSCFLSSFWFNLPIFNVGIASLEIKMIDLDWCKVEIKNQPGNVKKICVSRYLNIHSVNNFNFIPFTNKS